VELQLSFRRLQRSEVSLGEGRPGLHSFVETRDLLAWVPTLAFASPSQFSEEIWLLLGW